MEGCEAGSGAVEEAALVPHPSEPGHAFPRQAAMTGSSDSAGPGQDAQAPADPVQQQQQVPPGHRALSEESVGLSDHYLSLSVTVVGLGLAAAAAAAASLITHLPSLGWNFCILWLLWAGGVLGIVIGYAGPMVGAFALPQAVPILQDLIPPLFLGISEFLFFGPFLDSFTATSDISAALRIWFAATCIYGICTFAIILRARFLFAKSRTTRYKGKDARAVDSYIAYMTASLSGPVVLVVLAVLGELSWLIFNSKLVVTIFLSLIVAQYVLALWFHNIQARPWQAWLEDRREREPPWAVKRRVDTIRRRVERGELDGRYFLPPGN